LPYLDYPSEGAIATENRKSGIARLDWNLLMVTPAIVVAALLTLTPFLLEAFSPGILVRGTSSLPLAARLLAPAILCIPYAIVTLSASQFHWGWMALYSLLPVAVSALMWRARQFDPEQSGNWRDYLVLAVLGVAVDLRWFEPAWPAHLAVFNKMLLLDTGIYGLLTIRQIDEAGFDLRLRWRDLGFGLREFALYAPIAIVLGLSLGFLHFHSVWPTLPRAVSAYAFTFFFIAVPEELFFRGWLQNLLERRLGRFPALAVTAALFGLSHWNKRTLHFNWQYVLLAAIAGVFYGRAWRQERRVGASAITHAIVDTVWSIWLR
jgi:membrane protease YdiL (CAAX protease family)